MSDKGKGKRQKAKGKNWNVNNTDWGNFRNQYNFFNFLLEKSISKFKFNKHDQRDFSDL